MCTRIGIPLFASLILAACAPITAQKGAQTQETLGTDQVANPAVIVQPPTPTGSSDIRAASNARFEALTLCDSILISLPNQQLALKKAAYNRKQGGLLTTTVIGVAGSILTAVLAGTQKADANGSVDSKPATIIGASTAGATTIAGVVSLFVVGSGHDDKIQQLAEDSKLIATWENDLPSSCATLSDANALECKSQSDRLKKKCEALRRTLPYAVPEPVVLRTGN